MKGSPDEEDGKKGAKEDRIPTEEDLQRNIAIIEMTRNRIEAFTKEAEALSATIRDYIRAKETLEAMRDMEKPSEILVPIGGGMFIHAKPTTTRKVLVNIGTDVGTEFEVEPAIERLEARMKDLEGKEKTVIGELQKMEVQAEALTRETQAMYDRMQKAAREKASKG